MNKSGITPIEYKVLIKSAEVEKKSTGGIYLPDEHISRLEGAVMEGVIVALSPAAFGFHEDDVREASSAKVGDKVLFSKYAGQLQDGKDDEKYRLVNDRDIMAILE